MDNISRWLFRGPGAMRSEAEALMHGGCWGLIASVFVVALAVLLS